MAAKSLLVPCHVGIARRRTSKPYYKNMQEIRVLRGLVELYFAKFQSKLFRIQVEILSCAKMLNMEGFTNLKIHEENFKMEE